VLAAARGAQVTCVDLSANMLAQAAARMRHHGCQAEFVQTDVLKHDRLGHYDVVVVNFFLNVFAEGPMQDMLGYLARLARPGGKVLISDFATPRGNRLARAVQSAYWGVTDLFYYLLGLCAWHPIYDYASYFPEVGLELCGEKRFRPYGIGPGGFAALTAVRRAA
jgi:ubiquinone/menaquinone biosynthesis C-methylase UbiE